MALRRLHWLALSLLAFGCKGGASSSADRCANVTCSASDECHVAGVCDGATGLCSNPATSDGSACSGGTCSGGTCTAVAGLCAGVVCPSLDACHPAGSCDAASGACVSDPAPDGTPCAGGLCVAGVCTAVDGSCTDGAKNAAETDVDCGGPLCAGCVNGQACLADRDCMSGSCAVGRCAMLVPALVANPGPERAVAPGVHVVLDGSRSRSPSGAIATWSWLQTGGPAVPLGGADTAHPSFDAPPGPAEAVLEFTLTVGDGTSTASAPLRVLVRSADRPPETTSLGLILDAMSEGSLDRDTAVEYLAFSAYGDPRLPAEFLGTDVVPSGTTAMHIVAAEFPTLSPAAQEVIRPFLIPPAAPGSWAPPAATNGTNGPTALAAAAAAPGWVGVASQHLVIWYGSAFPNDRASATQLSLEAEIKIWPALRALFGAAHTPVLDDAAVNLVAGGTHGKLNVYLVSQVANGAYGMETPYGTSPTPSYIQVNRSLPFSGAPMGLSEALAHEMTHSFQDSYKQTEPYDGHRWIYEGTAAWAQDYVYPATNTEHQYARYYLDWPYVSLDDDWSLHPYGTYLFFQYATRSRNDADLIRRIFENFQTQTALDAVDHALQMGFQIWWSGFVDTAWNRDPKEGFWAVDGLTRGARVRVPAPVEMQMQGAGELAYDMDAGVIGPSVRHLGASYAHVSFPDPTARMILFYDGYMNPLAWVDTDGGRLISLDPSFPPDVVRWPFMSTGVLVKRGEAWQTAVPVLGGLVACQDDPADRIDELAVGFGYGYPVEGESMAPRGLSPRVWVSNIGCYQWTGTITGTKSSVVPGPPEETTATVTWVRDPRVAGPSFIVSEGSFTWKMDGTFEGCSYYGEDAWTGAPPEEAGLEFLPQFVDGPAHRGYSGGGGKHAVTYTVSCPDAPPVTQQTEAVWFNTTSVVKANWVPQVSADGLTAADTADDGHMIYTWSFTATPGQ